MVRGTGAFPHSCQGTGMMTDKEVSEMQYHLNIRPRQTLGWKNPAQAYMEVLEKVS